MSEENGSRVGEEVLHCHLILSSMATQIMSTRSRPGSSASSVSQRANSWSNGNSRPKRSLIHRLMINCKQAVPSEDETKSHIIKI